MASHSDFKKRRTATDTASAVLPDLPEDVILDILLRLPAKSLARFKSVCRPWCDLISNPSFYNTHPTLSSHEKVIVDAARAFNSRSPVIEVIGSCNGLLCLLQENHTPVLFNPATRESRQLPPLEDPDLSRIEPHNPAQDRVVAANTNYGFGFDPISQDYIVVAIRCFRNLNTSPSAYFYPSQLLLYTLRTNSWERLQDTPYLTDCHWSAQKSRATDETKSGILVNGALHWLSSFCGVQDSDYWSFVVAFDVVSRQFRETIPLPDYDRRYKLVQLSEIDGHLCFLSYYGHGVKVWRLMHRRQGLKNIYSWAEMFNLPPGIDPPSIRDYVPLTTSSDGRLILHKRYNRHRGLIVYNPVNKSYGERGRKTDLPATLVNSLVPLNK